MLQKIYDFCCCCCRRRRRRRRRCCCCNHELSQHDMSPVSSSVRWCIPLRTWSFWKGWNFWLFWISKRSNLWLLQIFLFKFQLLEMSVRPLKKSINIFKHDEKINFLKIWYLDVSWNFKKIDFFFDVFFPSNHHSNSQTRHILYKHIMVILNEIWFWINFP